MLEISDLSEHRHNAAFLHDEIIDTMSRNSLQQSSVIACVSDSAAAMVRMKKDLNVSMHLSTKYKERHLP